MQGCLAEARALGADAFGEDICRAKKTRVERLEHGFEGVDGPHHLLR